MNNTITIENLKVFAYHGVYPEETATGQDFYLTLKLYFDTSVAGMSDNLKDAIDYGDVCHFVTRCMLEKTFHLIEAAGEYVLHRLMLKYDKLDRVDLTLSKPHAPVELPLENIRLDLSRSWHKVYLSIGSNLGNRREYMDQAIAKLKSLEQYRIIRTSSYITTPPYGYTEQADFLNGAIYLKTLDSPHELLNTLHRLEQEAGRTREIHWGPRTLDLDIIFYDDLCLTDDDLVIPHPDMEHRDFVLRPLKEIAPNLLHPILGKRIKDMEI